MKYRLSAAFLVLFLATAGTAQAQRFELQGIYQRLSKLENDMGLVQRQAATGGYAAGAANPAATGQISAEMMRIDEEMRQLRGELERLSFQIDQIDKQQRKSQEDMDYRLQDIEKRLMQSAMPLDAASADEQMAAASSAPAMAGREDLTEELTAVVRGQEAGNLASAEVDDANLSARDLYNAAFKQLNQTNYEQAEKLFSQFTQRFPKDALIGNAWYWLGESHYVQRDYVKAADSFRNGYTKLPAGPKAGDNLLKLGMTLAAMKKTPEACVVLKQVEKKFAANSEAIKAKTRQEISRLGCK